MAMPLRFAVLLALTMSISSIAGELEDRNAMNAQVRSLLQQGSFEQLDTWGMKFQNPEERTVSGLWKLQIFHYAISKALPKSRDDAHWRPWEETMANWVRANPHSPAARVAYARMLINRGWSFRGSGYANTVPQEAWKPFHEYIEKARLYLEHHKAIAATDPQWYALMIQVAYAQSWTEKDTSPLIREALDRYPYYQQIYFSALDNLAPKWGGSAEKIEAFARTAVQRTESKDGYGMYARLYWYASQTQYDDKLFVESKVNWPTMKKGMDDVLRKYPDQWNLSNFAKISCIKGDRPKTAELMKQVSGEIPDAWKLPGHYEFCRDWALPARREGNRAPGN